MRKIKIKIDPMGTPTIEAEGFTGTSCSEATAGIERALGGGLDARDLKPEYYSGGDNQQENHISW